ncbi:MAG: ATP-binding protein [Paludibacteraceae bacterium]|nr:ATP-binding protein [Paludibacteraceae bacterium]
MRHLTIKHIGPIDFVDINLSRFNFFIGPQSSGKSTIAKVLSTCMWLEKEAATTLTEHLTYTTDEFVALIEEFHKIQGYFGVDSVVDYVTDSVVLHYDKKRALSVDLKPGINYHRQKVSYIPAERSAITLPELQGFEFGSTNMRSFLFDWFSARELYTPERKAEILNLDMRYFFDKDEKKYKDRVEHRNGKTYEISLSSASSGMQALIPLQLMVQYYTNEYFERYKLKSAFDDDEKDKLLRYRLVDKVVLEKLYPRYIESQRSELLREANKKYREGEKKYVELVKEFKAMYNQLAIPERTSFVIEEPEENLYPYSQIALVELLVKCCQTERKHEMVVTTHSPYVINYLNVLLRGSHGGVKIMPNDINVWAVSDGGVLSLNVQDAKTGEMLIDTYDLTEPMEAIFNEYKRGENEDVIRK